MGAVIYIGPGAGIVISGLVATATVAVHWSAASAWLAFGLLAAMMSATAWPVFSGPSLVHSADRPAPPSRPVTTRTSDSAAEMATLTAAYGLAGFGYIITATFLPVIAREALPGSVWLDLFWPIFGLAAIAGCLLSTRVPRVADPRFTLAACYVLQAVGVVVGLFVPTLAGFVAGSVLVGMPFTAIAFFAMQDVRRLRPHQAARFMGLLTAVYGIGQIAGPALVGFLLARTPSHAQGFALSLWAASAALATGAGLCVLMTQAWPLRAPGSIG
jgi:MFS family permease